MAKAQLHFLENSTCVLGIMKCDLYRTIWNVTTAQGGVCLQVDNCIQI